MSPVKHTSYINQITHLFVLLDEKIESSWLNCRPALARAWPFADEIIDESSPWTSLRREHLPDSLMCIIEGHRLSSIGHTHARALARSSPLGNLIIHGMNAYDHEAREKKTLGAYLPFRGHGRTRYQLSGLLTEERSRGKLPDGDIVAEFAFLPRAQCPSQHVIIARPCAEDSMTQERATANWHLRAQAKGILDGMICDTLFTGTSVYD